ncbi:GNAT family N-acetyltransferase [Brevibacillus fluminis]|uniref:GNAT family N-acetyltransferase n=1 Tax=Brevibacillus fluminis TaxID=511487 RepID=A0A3M8DW65_9BACL|nr:GNAT family N-acetyltransferase [Brevibacillus fluminis]RNB92332.1 GNAT family N-acetyltransferase [Brevibacillus fluminis]
MMIEKITEEFDTAQILSYASREKRAWGDLFFNEQNPTHYDANHADVSVLPADPDAVIDEVIQFYREKAIIPRFYLHNVEALAPFIEKLTARGFGYEEFDHAVQLWNGQLANVPHDDRVSIERVSSHNFTEAMEVECSIAEFGGRKVREKAFQLEFANPAYDYYLLYVDGVAASTACTFKTGSHIRLENVATRKEWRGQGLIGILIRHMQEEVALQGYKQFWVYPINEQVEKVYKRYHFDTVGRLRMAHAFLGGKSIKEIHAGN